MAPAASPSAIAPRAAVTDRGGSSFSHPGVSRFGISPQSTVAAVAAIDAASPRIAPGVCLFCLAARLQRPPAVRAAGARRSRMYCKAAIAPVTASAAPIGMSDDGCSAFLSTATTS